MNLDEMLALIQKLEAEVAAMKVPAHPAYEFDANHFLVTARQYGGTRLDPVVASDCPYTMTMTETGHTLSLARPELGEMFIGYVVRVSDQATGGDKVRGDQIRGSIGSLFLGTAWLFAPDTYKPDGSNWPRAADRFCNMRAYMTPEERAKDDANKAEWVAWGEVVKNQPPVSPPAPEPVQGELPL